MVPGKSSAEKLDEIGSAENTGVARNFDWGGSILEKNCDVILATFFGDIMVMMSRK